MLTPYRPEPYVNFAEAGPRQAMLDALAAVKAQLGRTYSLRIGAERVETRETFASIKPAEPGVVVGRVASATVDHAKQAIAVAAEAFKSWSRVEPEARARVLFRAAAIMRRRVYELSAWMCFEVSKSWIEAYADTCETIDFLDFYGREMVRLGGPQPVTPFAGEHNEVRFIPMGVTVVIPPWNFPLAIATGMTAAAIVAGNTVVLKPASASPVIAAKMAEVFEQAGLPPGVLNFLPGPGGAIGDALVDDPRTRIVAFTGSKEVGLRIFEKCGRIAPGQIWLKRSILEMGGKDCIIVDETADLDAAAEGVVASAFGFQGQKCSACSRLVAHEVVYGALLERVVERSSGLTQGDTTAADNFYMGAVIDERAFKKINDYIEIGRKEGRVVLGGEPGAPVAFGGEHGRPARATQAAHGLEAHAPQSSASAASAAHRRDAGATRAADGYFIPPTIIEGVAPTARIAQEEIFGPVLAVMKARDFDECLAIANGTEYGLTGGLFSNERSRLERARREFHVGNLYLNRKCTGALVDVQPFGGFNMSGTDSKAGGREYLLLFLQGKSIAERL